MQLRDYSISALLDFGVDTKTMRPWFSFAAMTQLLTLRINGLVYMGFSRYWEDRFSDDSDVLDVQCEYRQIAEQELGGYRFKVDDLKAMPKLMVLTIEGPLNVRIICESYDVSLEPLSYKFPELL